MQTENYTGMGLHFPVHDAYATETQGPVQDRPSEHLSYTDKAITAARRMLLRAIQDVQEGRDPPHVIRGAAANDLSHLVVVSQVAPPEVDWRTSWSKFAGAESLVASR